MDLRARAQQAVRDAGEIVGTSLSDEQRKALGKVIEDLMVDAMRECGASYGRAAAACCSEDEDMAHKIAREVKAAQTALIANLNSLR
jgi:hypothetical protein